MDRLIKEVKTIFNIADYNNVEGVVEGADALLLSCNKKGDSNLVIVPDIRQARKLSQNLNKLGEKAFVLEELDSDSNLYYHSSGDIDMERVISIYSFIENEKSFLIATASSIKEKIPSLIDWKKSIIKYTVGDSKDISVLIEDLFSYGYRRDFQINAWGDFSVRGNIVDIFIPGEKYPYRLEFFGDEIESIREFEVESQKSINRLTTISIKASNERFSDLKSEIVDLADNVIIFEREQCNLLTEGSFFSKYEDKCSLFISNFGMSEINSSKKYDFSRQKKYDAKLEEFFDDLVKNRNEGYNQILLLRDKKKFIEEELEFLKIPYGDHEDIKIIEGDISKGFYSEDIKFSLFSESDIFDRQKRYARIGKPENFSHIDSFDDLKNGDLVVHIYHGVGRYVGTQRQSVEGVERDYLALEYKGNDKLYIPTDQIDRIGKYTGGASSPIHSLTSGSWKRKLEYIKKSIDDMSSELIELYANRKAREGFAFSPDNDMQRDFESEFEFLETDDQLRSSEEIKKDMQSSYPMDRLLCGDVGFGKTEVAIRAIFKASMDSKQSIVLVPTTVLAQQYYDNFKKRFNNYPVNIEMLSRLRSKSEIEKTIRNIRNGNADVVIATHMIFSDKIKFKNLGLLVVDEEQRFGVKQKESIKMLKTNVDTLSMSATPIPRTMYMSMNGIRDISLISIPPSNRYPVQTYILEMDEDVIISVIKKEISREGQVYYIHNNISSIERIATNLSKRLKNVRIKHIHSRMSKNSIEDIMIDFRRGLIDVLVSTTIIETGMDISNVNTIIIENAHRLGLSQLYQLRGRVGRSSRIAYAYLFYPKGKVLSEKSIQRLETIREFTKFGSGYHIALRDVEIRGGGNILGAEQSGYFYDIGYDLYMKLLSESIDRARGIDVTEKLDTKISVDVSAYIPDEYISDEGIKISMYKKIDSATKKEDIINVEDELHDRFGNIPKVTRDLIRISVIKNLASPLGISSVVMEGELFRFNFDEKHIPSNQWFQKTILLKDKIKFYFKGVSYFVIFKSETNYLNHCIDILEKMRDL